MKNMYTGVKERYIQRIASIAIFISFLMICGISVAQVATDGDYRTRATGMWNGAGTWQVRASSSWSNTSTPPTSANTIYIQSGHTLTIDVLTADCKDLQIHTGGSVSIGTNKLQVSGKLRAYTGTAVTSTGVDGVFYSSQASSSSPMDAMLSTSGAGLLRFIGTTRTITANTDWSNTGGTGHATEFALTAGNTGTFNSGYKTAGITITSGTMDMGSGGTNRLAIDNGTTGQGDCTIQSGATLISSNSGGTGTSVMSRTATAATGRSGIFNLNGKLVLTGNSPEIQFTTVNINTGSTIEYAGAGQNFVKSTFSGAAAIGSSYYNVIFSGSGNKTPAGNFAVSNDLTISGTAVLPLSALTITVGGSWTNYGTAGLTESTSTVDFNGTGAQSINTTGGEDFFKVKKSAAGTLTLNSDARFAGASSELNISAGILDAGTNVLSGTASTTLTMSAGTLKLAKLSTTLPQFTGTYALSGASTIQLYGAGAQVLAGAVAYRNLTFSNTTSTTLASNPTSITGTVYITNTALLDIGSSNAFGNASTNLTMDGGRFKMAGVSSSKPDIDGTYTLTAGVIEFNGSSVSRQNIKGKNAALTDIGYQQIEVTGTNVGNSVNTITLNSGGSFTVKNGGTFTISDVAISGPTGSQTVTVENGAFFKTSSNQGFHGYSTIFGNNSALHQNIENIVLAGGSTVEYMRDGDQPITNSPVLVYHHLTLSGTTGIKTAPATTLTVNGNLTKSGATTFAHNNGTVVMGGSATQAYNSSSPVMVFYKLTDNNTVDCTINNDLSVENELAFGANSKLNLEDGNISIKSTSTTGTADIGKIPLTAAISYSAAGRFIIERYIPTGVSHGKSWQFLAVPTNGGQTINAAWQEGNAPLGNTNPNHGTIITNSTAGAGFDIIGGGAASMKTYNPATNYWTGISNTTATDIYNQKGYMIFVRGDRTVTTTGGAATETTLRTTGKIFDPVSNIPPITNVGSNQFESIGNPFASAIDFSNDLAVLKSANVQKVFYVWDPKLSGGYGFGAFQTFTKGDDPDNNYYVTPGGGSYGSSGSVNNLIQSGQAFFVHTAGGTGTVEITEDAKSAGSSLVYRPVNNLSNESRQLRNNLYVVDNGTAVLIDGVLNKFSNGYSNAIDISDAIKIGNFGENIAIARNNKMLAVERRRVILTADTIFYRLGQLKNQQYKFEFIPENIARPGLQAWLEDIYLGNKTPVSLTETTTISFNVGNNPGSYAAGRFRLVFRQRRIHTNDPGPVIVNRNDISVYPNPVINKTIRIIFIDQQTGKYLVQLMDLSGKVILEEPITVAGKQFIKELNAGQVAAGNYQLIFISPESIKTVRQVIIN